ncbi:hypothetical protein [Microbulbifer sp. NBRC 101763]|uniref:hypothetical protein n=1 Tax=Microbulbifer sp. NBRC 101763 TaxID=1113820 RepID=UPI003342DC2C
MGLQTNSLSSDDRKKISDGKGHQLLGYTLLCHKGVWDEGIASQLREDRYARICGENRENFCFYFPVHKGMSFKAAEELETREQEYTRTNKSNRYTLYGLLIAAFGLFANAVLIYFKLGNPL